MPFNSREKLLAYLEANKEKRARMFAEWEAKNRARRNEYRRELRKKSPPKLSAEERAKRNAYNRQWRAANTEKNRAYQAAWKARNPHRKLQDMARFREREYGLTDEQFQAMVNAQGGLCAVCAKQPKGSFHIDHCHQTGAVRGLLCGKCNRGLGMFYDDPTLLAKAAMYLERHQADRHTA